MAPRPVAKRAANPADSRRLLQASLGELAGLSREQVGRLEAGKALPLWETAVSLAEALECRVEEIFPAAGSRGRRDFSPPHLEDRIAHFLQEGGGHRRDREVKESERS